MNSELGKAILEKLQERVGPRIILCEICGGTRWDISGIVSLTSQPAVGSEFVIGGPMFHMALLTCTVCGNTKSLNLVALLGKERLESIVASEKSDRLLREALGEASNKEGGANV